jgi:glyceraldehyde 3-phosphate dehydrogenase
MYNPEPIRIAINGFGRIGRTLTRIIWNDPRFEIAAINDLVPLETAAHLLRYDSIHGLFPAEVSSGNSQLIIDGKAIAYSRIPEVCNLNWEDLRPAYCIDATGRHKTVAQLNPYIKSENQKVILTAPPEDSAIPMVVVGVNDNLLSASSAIVSNASCTTNNAAPMIKVIDECCGIESCYITTVHSYTGDQRLQDAPHRDFRRARAAALSIIPTSTGAAKALTRVFPHLAESMGGCGMRVPVPDGSLTDITCIVRNPCRTDELNAAFRLAAESSLKHILQYTEDPIVSVDVIGNPHSCVFDSGLTSVIGRMVKVVGWYDNEFGYSSRLRDLVVRMSDQF